MELIDERIVATNEITPVDSMWDWGCDDSPVTHFKDVRMNRTRAWHPVDQRVKLPGILRFVVDNTAAVKG